MKLLCKTFIKRLALSLLFLVLCSSIVSAVLIDNGDGTVSDTDTGLMWQQAEAGNMDWQSALAYCENLVLPVGGYDDWRLPDRNEIHSLIDGNRRNPSLDRAFFPGVISSAYWSSTSNADIKDGAWTAEFYDGSIGFGHNKMVNYFVRAVRSGQSGPAPSIVFVCETQDCDCNGNLPCHDTIKGAYVEVNNQGLIKIAAGFYLGDLNFDRRPLVVTLSGGWNSDFSSKPETCSSIGGSLVISQGCVTVAGLSICGIRLLASNKP